MFYWQKNQQQQQQQIYQIFAGQQNSLGIIMCKFHAFQSKTEGMAASVRVFLEHPSY